MGSQALVPLGEGLSPEARALAEALRTLFDGLDETLTRYAARMHLDKGTVSRYLSGQRVPHWDFIHNLLVQSAKSRGGASTQDVVSHLKDLHQAALEVSGTDHDRILKLQDQLSEALGAADRARLHEQVLQQALDAALQAAQQRNAELEITAREATYTADRTAAELDRYRDEFDDERQQLNDTIEKLRTELHEAQQLHRAAEKRAQQLERQLEQAEHGVAEQEVTKQDQRDVPGPDTARKPGQGTFGLWDKYRNNAFPNVDASSLNRMERAPAEDTPLPNPGKRALDKESSLLNSIERIWSEAILHPSKAGSLPWIDEPPPLEVDDSPTLDLTADLISLLPRDEAAGSSAKKSSWLRRRRTKSATPLADEAPHEL